MGTIQIAMPARPEGQNFPFTFSWLAGLQIFKLLILADVLLQRLSTFTGGCKSETPVLLELGPR